ncbi:ABC transporter substrate-binding protein [Microbacterium sp. Root61]|uniref:ABC transporter family substrate-binding protein n=1 Tax=Microbacterium sp. Root61 TaxID=1736570 RepID=UPI0006F5428B|nr:ABC transporter family substrate-binding protein [Microbacterium sp. Root61]KRA23794.1 ABC transporter substrate-binding protein [Microbacterium sp. Root61]
MSAKTWRVRALAVAAGVGVTAVALAACTSPGGGGNTTQPVVDTQVSLAETNELSSFNPNTPQGNLDINSKVNYATHDTFAYINDKMEVVPNEGFGKMEKVSDDPLTVKYTLNDGLKWSDGEAITTDDLLLGWAIASGYFDDATFNDDGEVTAGTQYFTIAGSTVGVNDTDVPEVSDDKKSLTLVYETPFVDWNLVWLLDQPIHVVADKAGVTVDELVKAITTTPKGDADAPAEPNATIKAAADFWNTGFDVTSLPDDPSLYLSNGPFIVKSWEPTQSMTLEANPEYTGDHNPAFSTLVFRFVGDSQAQVTALQNGEVDIINPQAGGDTLTLLEGLSGIQILSGPQLAYDHVDISFKGEFADPTVREAFMKVIPRQQIVDTVIKPVNPDAEVLNSQIYVTSQTAPYAETIKTNGSDAYADVDVEGAKTLLAGKTPTVRILYNINNPNRVAAFEAIQATAQEAGFVVEDIGREDWGAQLGSDIYDVSIFGWISPGVGNASIPQIFASFGGGNYNGVNVPEIDQLANDIQVMTDPADVETASMQVDKLLFENFYGLPLFQSPGLEAHTDRVKGVTFMANQTGPVWNFWEWTAEGTESK